MQILEEIIEVVPLELTIVEDENNNLHAAFQRWVDAVRNLKYYTSEDNEASTDGN